MRVARVLDPLEVRKLSDEIGIHVVGGVSGSLSLVVRKTASGTISRTWRLSIRKGGTAKVFGLGAYAYLESEEGVTLSQARAKAQEIAQRLAEGKAPRATTAEVGVACSLAVEPTEGSGAASVSAGDSDESFNKSKAGAMTALPGETLLTKSVGERIVMVETAAFTDRTRWKVKFDCRYPAVYVSISDEDFLRAIDSGKERFGKGDFLLVELEMKQPLSKGRVLASYDIKKVLEHMASVEELYLFQSRRLRSGGN